MILGSYSPLNPQNAPPSAHDRFIQTHEVESLGQIHGRLRSRQSPSERASDRSHPTILHRSENSSDYEKFQPQATTPQSYTSSNWMSWARTAWSYFAPGVGVNTQTGLHMANLDFDCFTDWDLASYIMSIIYAYKLGLITASGTWQFNDRITKVMNFLMQRQLLPDGTPYDFYSDSESSGQYVQCPHTAPNPPTSASDTGRLLGALSILETVTSAYDSDVDTILARSQSTYDHYRKHLLRWSGLLWISYRLKDILRSTTLIVAACSQLSIAIRGHTVSRTM